VFKCISYLKIVFLLAFLYLPLSAEIRFTDYTNGSCYNHSNIADWPGKNLADYYCIIACDFDDTLEFQNILKMIGQTIYNKYPELPGLKDAKYSIMFCYAIEDYENIIIFGIPNPVSVDGGFDVAWNRKLNKYYVLNDITTNELNDLLSSEKFSFYTEFEILRYCVLISCLQWPYSPIKLLSSTQDLMLTSVLNNPIHSLDFMKKYKNVTVEMPEITQNGNDWIAIYYFAVGEAVVKIRMEYKKGQISEYNETKVAIIPELMGHMPR
jgi:hypothetical protein